jgi:osmotically-inducible protein OsmY
MIDRPYLIKIAAFLIVSALFGMPSLATATDETGLRQRIHEQVRSDEQLDGAQVSIAVKGGEVVLTGTVRLYSQKMRYEQLVWRTPGVMDLDNEIRVRPHGMITDRDIKSQLLNIKLKYPRFQAAVIQVSVNSGQVNVSGTFHDASDVLFLKHRLAEIEGVIRIEIEVQYAV